MNKAVYCLLGPTQFEEEMGSMHKYGSTMDLMHANEANDDENNANAQVQLGNLQQRRRLYYEVKERKRR